MLDVIACNSELESYLAAVICRNIGPHRIFITQTFDAGHTAAYLAAMSLMLAVDAGNRVGEQRPLLKEFNKYCSGWGGGKRGEYYNSTCFNYMLYMTMDDQFLPLLLRSRLRVPE